MTENPYNISKGSKNATGAKFLSEVDSAKKSLKKDFLLNKILGSSRVIQDLRERISKISQCDVNVLISGETGTGKEITARAIHYLGHRSGKPFVPVNCGAIPENLFENELFGHSKGAFTDACMQQNGLVREAEGGTLFLDEIGVVNPYIQVKLLRLLQDNEYKPLGDSRPRKADIRIIAATNMELLNLINEGNFREDLYYRLNIVSIHIPPLRERKKDIPILVQYFLKKYCREYQKKIDRLSPNCLDKLNSYDWPGNIRELENKMQQIIVMASNTTVKTGEIEIARTNKRDEEHTTGSFNQCKRNFINSFEKNYLSDLLSRHRGNMVQAAREAGKSRTGLWNLLKKHGLSPTPYKSGISREETSHPSRRPDRESKTGYDRRTGPVDRRVKS